MVLMVGSKDSNRIFRMELEKRGVSGEFFNHPSKFEDYFRDGKLQDPHEKKGLIFHNFVNSHITRVPILGGDKEIKSNAQEWVYHFLIDGKNRKILKNFPVLYLGENNMTDNLTLQYGGDLLDDPRERVEKLFMENGYDNFSYVKYLSDKNLRRGIDEFISKISE